MPHDEIQFLPDIYKLINADQDVSLEDQEEFVQSIADKYNLPLETAQIIINCVFEEMRNAVLDAKVFYAKELGSIRMSSPLLTRNKREIFPAFRPSKHFKNILNAK